MKTTQTKFLSTEKWTCWSGGGSKKFPLNKNNYAGRVFILAVVSLTHCGTKNALKCLPKQTIGCVNFKESFLSKSVHVKNKCIECLGVCVCVCVCVCLCLCLCLCLCMHVCLHSPKAEDKSTPRVGYTGENSLTAKKCSALFKCSTYDYPETWREWCIKSHCKSRPR